MRIKNSILCLIVFILIPAVSFSQKKKSDEEMSIAPEPAFVEGIVYSLPRTGFKIDVKAVKTTFVPGPYAAYAEKYLGIKNVGTTESINWKIKEIAIKTFAEPDPDAVFKAMNTVASQISQLSNGIITGIKSDGYMKPAKLIGGDVIVKSDIKPTFTDLSSDDNYVTAVNPETGAEKINFKSNEDKAREAADYIIRLRKKRAFTILDPSNIVPEDGKGYEAFLKEAQRLDQEYTRLFTGKNTESKHQFSFIVVPDGNDMKNEVLFRFSEDKGVVSKTDISGKPILFNLTKDANFAKSVNQLKKSDNPKAGKSGVYYRIPAMADLSITDGINTLYTGRTNVPQFGAIAPLPEHLLDGNHSIKFDPEGGTILEVEQLR